MAKGTVRRLTGSGRGEFTPSYLPLPFAPRAESTAAVTGRLFKRRPLQQSYSDEPRAIDAVCRRGASNSRIGAASSIGKIWVALGRRIDRREREREGGTR